MSLYDDASLIFTPAGAAGNHNTAHSIKPALELYQDSNVVTNGTFSNSGTITQTSHSLGWTNSSASEGTSVIEDGVLKLTNTGDDQDRADAYASNGSNANILEFGTTYYVKYTVVDNDGGSAEDLRVFAGSSNDHVVPTSVGNHSVIVTVGSSGDRTLIFQSRSKFSTLTLDNISAEKVKVKPIDFKIDRGSDESATLVGADGLIKKHTHNLLKATEDLNNSTYWSIPGDWYDEGVNQGPSYTNPLPEGEVVGYNGSKEGVFTLDKTAGHNNYFMAVEDNNEVTTTADEVWTYSVYAKAANDVSELLMGIWANPAIFSHGYFNFPLSGESRGGNANDNETNPKSQSRYYMEKIGDDGWYRCSITNVSAIDGERVRLQPREPYSIDGNTHQSAGKVYIMHPQFEKGSGPTPYVKSGNVHGKGGVLEDSPRFDYSGGGCPGLLLERQVTNLLKQSEWFKSWQNNGDDGTSTIIPNYSISPDGSNNATKYTANDGYRHLRLIETLETDTKYVFSFYAKNIDATQLIARVYDLDESSWVIDDYNYLSEVNTTEWKRIEVPFTTKASSTSYGMYISQGRQTSTEGESGGSVLFWGAQLEKQNHSGSAVGYATSYIPNTSGTGTVTRQHDDTDDTDFRFGRDNIFDGDQATIFIESNNLRKVGNSRWWHIFDEDKKEDPRILLYSANGVDLGAGERGYNIRLQLRADHDHTRETILNGPNLNYGDTFKAIARLNNNIVTLFVNGTQYDAGATESVSYDYAQWEPETVRPYDRFELAHQTGDLGHKIFNLMIFPTVLTDDECKNLTSLS